MPLKTLKDLTNTLDIEYPDLPIRPNISIRREVLKEVNKIEPNIELHSSIFISNTPEIISVLIHKYFSRYLDEN